MARWGVYLDERDWHASRQLYVVRRDGNRGAASTYVTGFTFETVPEGAMAPAEAMALKESREDRADNLGDVTNFLQAALDCAWAAGMRPQGYEDNRAELNGELNATKAHLADMRKMAKVPGA